MRNQLIYRVLRESKIPTPFFPNLDGGQDVSCPEDPKFLGSLLPQPPENLVKNLRKTLSEHGEAYLDRWRYHKLTPFLFSLVCRYGWQEVIAPGLLEKLRADYGRALRASSLQEREIRELLIALEQHGIALILLKGVDLRGRLYGDPAVRPMADVDLFIAPEARAKAQQLLGELGYRVHKPSEDSSTRLKEKFGNELFFRPPAGKILWVDLHWEIEAVARLYRLPFKEVSVSAPTIDYHGIPVRILAPEHLVIHISLHLMSHWPMDSRRHPPSALQILDVLWALDRLPLDWPRFMREVERFQCSLPVYCIFREISPLAPHLVPTEIFTALGDCSSWWHEGFVLSSWHGLGRIYHRYPWLEDYLPRFAPLRRMWMG